MKYVNLTAHDIILFKNPQYFVYDTSIKSYVPKERNFEVTSKNSEIFPRTGNVVRCRTVEKSVPSPDHIPYIEISYGEIIPLPEPKEDTVYLVSNPVATAALQLKRDDIKFRIPARIVRDYSGRHLGCLAFAKVVWKEKTNGNDIDV